MGIHRDASRRERGKFYEGLIAALLEFAEPNFRLWKYDDKHKRTRLEMLQAIQKQTGKISTELSNVPTLPAESAHVWRWWLAMHAKRRSNGMGIGALTWSDVGAYFDLIRTKPLPWEVDAIDRIDTLYLWTQNPKSEKPITGLGALKKNIDPKPRSD